MVMFIREVYIIYEKYIINCEEEGGRSNKRRWCEEQVWMFNSEGTRFLICTVVAHLS